MSRLPVIVGFGGYSPAGRSSFHHAFRRCVLDSLPAQARQETLAGLAQMMGLISSQNGQYQSLAGEPLSLAQIEQDHAQAVRDGTLIRRIEARCLDVDAAPWQKNLSITGTAGKPLVFITQRKQLPEPLPSDWVVEALNASEVQVTVYEGCDVKVDSLRELPVKSAGQLPSGFEPAALYHSHFHPRGLQLAIVGATDALRASGLSWEYLCSQVAPDQIAVFSGSVMSQLDDAGYGGLLQSRLKGQRVSAKMLPLGLNTMPADFINAYVLGSVGSTGSVTGACATFLYNLQKAIDCIHNGSARVVLVGNSEAPLTAECIEGYAAMGALASEEGLRQVQERNGEGSASIDWRRASRPFGDNCGFTLAESSQYVLLMDDELALQLGADIHGALPEVFINADGFKKSISAPGPGNYLTMAKAVASAIDLLGEDCVRRHSFVHAHGSSTPANRVTESVLLDRVAQAFGISQWPVCAIKAYLGHSLAAASADQLIAALGSFQHGLLPGIKTISAVADDVQRSQLDILTADREQQAQLCFLNSKGFGGNNASAVVLAPALTEQLLSRRHGAARLASWRRQREQTRAVAQAYEQHALHGQLDILYQFGHQLIDEQQLQIDRQGIRVPGFAQPIRYAPCRYADLRETR